MQMNMQGTPPHLEKFELGSRFLRHFRVEAATTDGQLDDVFRIRHEVYCEDLKFEPERPDRRERDAFDEHSLHCLLKTTGKPSQLVGCARLVRPDMTHPELPLPFEIACRNALDSIQLAPRSLPQDKIAEVSRLAVRRMFRRRRGEEHLPITLQDEDFGSASRPRFPYIPVALYLGIVALAHENGIETLFMLTEPRLASHFKRLGVDIQRIGEPVDHRGTRIPSVLDVHGVIKNLRPAAKPIWQIVHRQIGTSLR